MDFSPGLMLHTGVWHGQDASIALTADMCIAFLRMKEDEILSLLHNRELGVMCIVRCRGMGQQDVHASWWARNPITGDMITSDDSDICREMLERHSLDALRYDERTGKLCYTLQDGRVFETELGEAVDSAALRQPQPIDPTLSIPERMARWNQYEHSFFRDGYFGARLGTRRYNINFELNPGQFIYCRVGQNAYCEKGWAMRSTTCLRAFECRMIPDNRDALQPYHAIEACFVENGCAFPPDGGWYWSLQAVTDDEITLNGCGGDIYKIYRPR